MSDTKSPFAMIRHGKKRAFLKAYAETGGILSHAAKAAGCDRHSHYNWMKDDADYAALFESIAKDMAYDRLEDEATRRAVDGWDEPVYQGGELVGFKRRYSDTLLIFMLNGARPEKYRRVTEHTGAIDHRHGTLADFTAQLLQQNERAGNGNGKALTNRMEVKG